MTDRDPTITDPELNGPDGELMDDGTTGELLEEKNVAEDLLRADAKADAANANDMPGFDDGRLGGFDGEVRQGEPNDDGEGGDAAGEEEGGVGTSSNGGVDGGPARTRPLPGK
ncbi:hypothetical protein [Deinococcus sp.]|uniref:hypothetical protein n=1 Tax=Deinococcus sp. TaxID=47478 RepID=UPI003B5B49EF